MKLHLPKNSKRILVPDRKRGVYRVPKPARPKPFYKDYDRCIEFLQSFGAALLVNIVIVALLSIAAVRFVKMREPVIVEVMASPSPEKKEKESEASSSESSAKKREQKSSDVDNPEKTVQEAIQANSLSQYSLPSISLPSSGEEFSSGAAEFGIGESVGKQGLELGVSPGEMGTIFAGKGLGEGGEMLLYVDSSRSMWKHARAVTDLVENLFPRSKIVRVEGCAIVEDGGLVRAIESDWTHRKKIFFVCDLRDEVTYEGLRKLRSLLLDDYPTKELHIISFERRPMIELKSIVDESWGSVSLVYAEPPN